MVRIETMVEPPMLDDLASLAMPRSKKEKITVTPLPGVTLAIEHMNGVPAASLALNVTGPAIRKWLQRRDMSEVQAISVFALAMLGDVDLIDLIGEEAIKARLGREIGDRVIGLAKSRKSRNAKQNPSSGPRGSDY
jgi:hypothetical protein